MQIQARRIIILPSIILPLFLLKAGKAITGFKRALHDFVLSSFCLLCRRRNF